MERRDVVNLLLDFKYLTAKVQAGMTGEDWSIWHYDAVRLLGRLVAVLPDGVSCLGEALIRWEYGPDAEAMLRQEEEIYNY
jgi:hypothetical protein